MITNISGGIAVLIACACCLDLIGAESMRLELQAGDTDRSKVPIACELSGAVATWKHFTLVVEKTGKEIPCQVVQDAKPRLIFMLEEPLAAGQSRIYRLKQADQPSGNTHAAVRISRDDRVLSIALNEKPVLVYNHAVVASDDPKEPAYRRSGFIHPLYDPQGNVISDGMPPDHMHQHGIMYAWVNTTFREHAVDFWNSAKHEGAVRHKDVLRVEEGPALARFRTSLEHVDLTQQPDSEKDVAGTVVLRETWQVTVYNRTDGFLFDIESEQSCATDDPLVINKYHYGGMAFRGARHWSGAEGCQFLTSEGKGRISGNHTAAWWCDIAGASQAERGDAKVSGLTMFCAPENFRAPQTLRLHPSMPYFVWSPMVDEGFQIGPGSPYKARYRYFVHAGAVDESVAEQISSDFRNPAKVVVVE